MSNYSTTKRRIANWFSALASEISNSPLGAIGLFIGSFGLFLALLTSWNPLIVWIAKYWPHICLSIAMALGPFWLLGKIKELSSEDRKDEHLAEAYRILSRLAESMSLTQNSVKEKLKEIYGEQADDIFDDLVNSQKINIKLGGRIIVEPEEGEVP